MWLMDFLLVYGRVIEQLVARLRAKGLTDVLVEWGGDVMGSGNHPERYKGWRVELTTPPSLAGLFASFKADPAPLAHAKKVPPLACIELRTGSAIAVSGDFANVRKFGYHHVVDPRTGQLLRCDARAPAMAAVEACCACAMS